MKRIAILGSTGSVGMNGCRVARALKDRVQVTAVAAHSQVDLLAAQAKEFGCTKAVIYDESRLAELRAALPANCQALCGMEGLVEAACSPDTDMVLCSIIGTAGLRPVMEAIRCGKEIALASKEVLVMAGEPVMKLAAEHHTKLIPVDSEHSAIFQCLNSRLDSAKAERLLLTSSGGPFRRATAEEIRNATWEQAQAHPTWSMGQKITIDSATLMNKALEMVEAHFLFDCPAEKIQVLVHPQSIVHSMVEYPDGTVIALLSVADMRFPIQYAFTCPERCDGGLARLDFAKVGHLDFEEPDETRFPSLGYARQAIRAGGTLSCVMNAANEVAYERFRQKEIRLPGIWEIIEKTMNAGIASGASSLEGILEADREARIFAKSVRTRS